MARIPPQTLVKIGDDGKKKKKKKNLLRCIDGKERVPPPALPTLLSQVVKSPVLPGAPFPPLPPEVAVFAGLDKADDPKKEVDIEEEEEICKEERVVRAPIPDVAQMSRW
ncbi:hypothetical protein ACLOJK_040640 [Asimina triloba]